MRKRQRKKNAKLAKSWKRFRSMKGCGFRPYSSLSKEEMTSILGSVVQHGIIHMDTHCTLITCSPEKHRSIHNHGKIKLGYPQVTEIKPFDIMISDPIREY